MITKKDNTEDAVGRLRRCLYIEMTPDERKLLGLSFIVNSDDVVGEAIGMKGPEVAYHKLRLFEKIVKSVHFGDWYYAK